MLGDSSLANRSRTTPRLHRYSLEAKERDGPGARGTKQFKRALPSDFVRASTHSNAFNLVASSSGSSGKHPMLCCARYRVGFDVPEISKPLCPDPLNK